MNKTKNKPLFSKSHTRTGYGKIGNKAIYMALTNIRDMKKESKTDIRVSDGGTGNTRVKQSTLLFILFSICFMAMSIVIGGAITYGLMKLASALNLLNR